MKTIAKATLGALALASLGAMTATPANAQASFGFSFGTGPVYGSYNYGYYPGYYGGYYASPCAQPYRYRPAYCGYTYRRPGYTYYYGYPSRYTYARPRGYAYGYGYRSPYYGRRY